MSPRIGTLPTVVLHVVADEPADDDGLAVADQHRGLGHALVDARRPARAVGAVAEGWLTWG